MYGEKQGRKGVECMLYLGVRTFEVGAEQSASATTSMSSLEVVEQADLVHQAPRFAV